MADRRAIVVTTETAAGARTNGATLRAGEVIDLLERTGHGVVRTTPSGLAHLPGSADVAVAVSYACAGILSELRHRAPRLWLDAVDSWLLVDGSGLRSGRPAYALRAVRDAWRLATMARPDLVTYISGTDLVHDRGTVRASARLVLPGGMPPVPSLLPAEDALRRVVLAGDWTYAPNRDGLRWFSRRILPDLERRLPAPDWEVVLYGTGVPHAGQGRVRPIGYAAEPAELYQVGDVHAAPIRFGGGVKRKVLAPLLAGLPVVTTLAGAHGLRGHALLDVATEQTFARALAHRLQAPASARSVAPEELVDRDDSAAVLAWLEARTQA